MNKPQKKTGRRAFLRESVQTLVAAPLAVASMPTPLIDDVNELAEEAGPLPGDPGYRDSETYGSLAD